MESRLNVNVSELANLGQNPASAVYDHVRTKQKHRDRDKADKAVLL